MKKLKYIIEYSSIFPTIKWVEKIEINGFSSKKFRKIEIFLKGLDKLLKEYNKKKK